VIQEGSSRPAGAVLSGAAGIAGAAVVIAGLTVLARAAGFGRVVVFAQAVGPNCLADTYLTANTVPNIVFEIVAGGMLASAVVPLLGGDVGAGAEGHARASRTASALLSWVTLLLVPVAVLVAVLAEPISAFALQGKAEVCPGSVPVAASMLRVFAPQIVLYGIGIVLTGVLQAYRRFAGPALAPLLSSVVVAGAYVGYAVLAGPTRDRLDRLDRTEELVLSVGTTLGVVVLTAPLLGWLRPVRLRLRPTLRFPPGVAARAMRLGIAGLAVLLAQQAAVTAALLLANGFGAPEGQKAAFDFAQTVYLLPWAVLAVPVATAAFPALAAAAAAGDRDEYAGRLSGAVRAVVLGSALGGAALVATAPAVAQVLAARGVSAIPASVLADGVIAFAPGLVGYGLVALLTRALYALDAARAATVATVAGWAVVVGAGAVLALMLPAADRVAALAWGNSIGMTVAGVGLLAATARRAGRSALARLGRTVLAAILAAVPAAIIGRLVAGLAGGGSGSAVVWATTAAVVVLVVFLAVGFAVARGELGAMVATVRRRPGRPEGIS